jgi:dTDP-4-dehydrorhamnose reductase
MLRDFMKFNNLKNQNKQIEIWAGLESTINRVGDTWFDQCARNGHANRIEDLDLFASLGVRKIRYPVLWEKIETQSGSLDFSWIEPRLLKLQSLGIETIATLLQHGSGPRHTSLIDPQFPVKLANYAKAIAEKFPEIAKYTPVNEPLTTARFSGLYGVWYPHGKSNATMLKALLNECRGTILAMKEIRKINPQAQLIQTEDLGRAQGTKPCLKMVEFQNHRRWLSYDLLFGKLNQEHPLWNWALANEVQAQELEWFLENPCPPDVIGINHYPLSNRFLDHRADLYRPEFHGMENGLRFADLGVPQVTEHYPDQDWAPIIPPIEILRDVSQRYQAPIAVTEVHIAGTREAQLQWLYESWTSAQNLREEGVDVRAITPWSLLGSFDWNTLCSKHSDFYEPGVFDVRAPTPRPTALANIIKDLAQKGESHHPVLENSGIWYRRPAGGTPILITGANGTLGRAFARIAEQRHIPYVLVGRAQLDITSPESVRNVLEKVQPWAVINTAGYVRVDEAETESDRAYRENVLGSLFLAEKCREMKISYMSFSSDLVFDGSKDSRDPLSQNPYVETDRPAPLNVYGRTKAEMESRVLEVHPDSLVVRTSSFFSPWDPHNFAVKVLQNLRDERPFEAVTDVIMAPTYVPDLVNNCLDLLIDGVTGIAHLANRGQISWSEFARSLATLFDLDHRLIRPQHLDELDWRAKRPHYSVLSSERFQVMPPLEEALERFQKALSRNDFRIVAA